MSDQTATKPALDFTPPRSGLAALQLRDAWHLLPWGIAIAFYFYADGFHSFGTNVLIMVLFTLSLDLALGYAGIITLGHAAFFGIGAYTAGVVAVHMTTDPIAGLILATILAGILGVLTGMLILHTQGVAMFMLTLAIASMFYEVANQLRSVTGGDDGLTVPRSAPLLAYFGFAGFRFDFRGMTGYLYTLSVVFVWFVIAWRIVKSPFGRSLDGIRQNPRRMRAIGTPVWWRLVAMYGISAAMAGTAGGLQAQATRLVGLTSLELQLSGIVAVMLVLGGERRLYGAFLGAVFFMAVQDWAAAVNPVYWMFVIGGLLMAVVLFLEGGLMGLLDKIFGMFAGKRVENAQPSSNEVKAGEVKTGDAK